MSKQCTKCLAVKPLDEYHHQRGKPRSQCKVCIRADNVARAALNVDRYEAKRKEWRAANPEQVNRNARTWQIRNPVKHRFGRHKSVYKIDFNVFWEGQGGLCASCHLPMKNGGKEPDSVCVDHDRRCCPGKKSCGKCVRGLIHRNCNLVLGYANDDSKILQSAIEYLARWEVSSSSETDG